MRRGALPKVGAVVLAGGRGSRALLKVGEQPLFRYAVRSVAECSLIKRGVVVGSAELRSGCAPLLWVAEGGPFAQNLRLGVEALGEAEDIIALSADLPFLNARILSDFLQEALVQRADFLYPIIPKELVERLFPGLKRTFRRLKEGTFTGGNVVLFRRDFFPALERFAKVVHSARKKPWLLASMLGGRTLWGLLVGTLSLPQLEERASRILGGQVRALVCRYPEIGVDVDDPREIPLVEKLLTQGLREG